MASFAERLIALVEERPGMTDRELTDILKGKLVQTAQVNQEARLLESRGILVRRRREDGLIGNYPGDHPVAASHDAPKPVIKRTPVGQWRKSAVLYSAFPLLLDNAKALPNRGH